ncbi:MAG: hypothetical protein SWK90_14345 [Chloroflexota bacterium]|nr:hypothetical protein [Chloroflexota bacterium]
MNLRAGGLGIGDWGFEEVGEALWGGGRLEWGKWGSGLLALNPSTLLFSAMLGAGRAGSKGCLFVR